MAENPSGEPKPWQLISPNSHQGKFTVETSFEANDVEVLVEVPETYASSDYVRSYSDVIEGQVTDAPTLTESHIRERFVRIPAVAGTLYTLFLKI